MHNFPGEILTAKIHIYNQVLAGPVPARVFGNFLEHLGFAVDGGVLAQALANPTFEHEDRLTENQVATLLQTGKYLVSFYQSNADPGIFPEGWSPAIGATGFGVAALDDYRSQQIPFPWAPLGQLGLVKSSVGRLGGAARLIGSVVNGPIHRGECSAANDGPTGIRQGIFLPFQRCCQYTGHVWVRIAALDPAQAGKLMFGLQRRAVDSEPAEILAVDPIDLQGIHWQKISFTLQLDQEQVTPGEPVDFFLRWLPSQPADVLVDQAVLLPVDAVEGLFDPDVLQMVKDWKVPLLRWPGGNFVSHYHWRDGVGTPDRRPTRPNYAWGGLETNSFGTTEFIHFCRLIGAEAHLVVNSGTGTAEEAAAWVEYCNGGPETPMGALRVANDSAEPYQVKLWEIGNEIYGSWQGGFHGADENALRCKEFSAAMRRVDPSLELIATGNQFDIAQPGPGFDHTQADRRWNQAVLELNPGQIDYLSLHCLPANDQFLEQLTDEQAYYSLMAQPLAWENLFLPDLRHIEAQANGGNHAVRIAITEWGVLGSRGLKRPIVENFGEVPYAGIFLNMMMRNCSQVPISNATALLHGGCIRKAGGRVFFDPQYLVIQKYTQLAGAYVLRCEVESPTYAVETAPDLGLPLDAVPLIDTAVCKQTKTGRVTACIVNRSLDCAVAIGLDVLSTGPVSQCSWEFLTYPDLTARARLGDSMRFTIQAGEPALENGGIQAVLPPCSVSWISYTIPLTLE